MQKKIAYFCRSILSDKNTRNLFFFLLLNLFFAFVELTYGLWTNSLGLISDSFHMFFDCSALLLGLAASLVTKKGPNDKYTYGFARAEILAGLANGLFLLFIALFIMKEAIERTFEPPEVHHERLFVISVLGFIVNLVGIFVFQHGGQGGCSHSHTSHSKPHLHGDHVHNEDHNSHGYNHYSEPTIYNKQQAGVVALDMNGYSAGSSTRGKDAHHHHQHPAAAINNYTRSENSDHHNNHHGHHHGHHHDHNHGHHHDHNHDHYHDGDHDKPLLIDEHTTGRPKSSGRGHIMQSVFLHIVADTLGSVGVMISAVLMNQFGWLIADPLCSLFIAILISVSVYPLLRDSFYVLMQRVPVELEDKLPDCLSRIQGLNNVISIHESHFWTLCSDIYVGCLKLEVAQNADCRYILANAKTLLNQLGVDKVHIQIDII